MSRMFEGARRTIASLAQWAEESRMVGRELWEELHRARAVDGVSVLALARRVRTGPQGGAAVSVAVAVAPLSARGEDRHQIG